MNPTHETHSIEQLEATRAELRVEHADLAREHGTYYSVTYAPGTIGAGEHAGGGRYDHSSDLTRLSREIAELEYEIICAQKLAHSGFSIGDRVSVGAPYQPFGYAAGISPEHGLDAITGKQGRVKRITGDGQDLLLTFDDGREEYAPITRCAKVAL